MHECTLGKGLSPGKHCRWILYCAIALLYTRSVRVLSIPDYVVLYTYCNYVQEVVPFQ